jgi:hypothetical protein
VRSTRKAYEDPRPISLKRRLVSNSKPLLSNGSTCAGYGAVEDCVKIVIGNKVDKAEGGVGLYKLNAADP